MSIIKEQPVLNIRKPTSGHAQEMMRVLLRNSASESININIINFIYFVI